MISILDYYCNKFPLFRLLINAVFCIVIILSGCENRVEQPEPVQTVKPKKAEFVDRQLCIDCHEDQYKEWIGSHHDLAMDVATEETVTGDFNDSSFTHHGVISNTSWTMIDVGCQACHGPGSNHIKWAQSGTDQDSAKTAYVDMGLDVSWLQSSMCT